MELISQHAKKIMEGCKERARSAGLAFQDDTLEYIVTNRDMLELSPKTMIPTLYDYWVQDVEVLRETGRYELFPSNPYETVINTRPPISFYNDNNPDWLNVMIFYHVIGHIDFFQNNLFFQHTWNYDFTGKALSDKRLISQLRSEKGRWVDYVIEFAKAIDNLVGYFSVMSEDDQLRAAQTITAVDYYFDIFLQEKIKVSVTDYVKEIEQYNRLVASSPDGGEQLFLDDVQNRYAEFESYWNKHQSAKKHARHFDLLQFLMEHSGFLNQEENIWMKMVIEVIRNTSLYFQPQIRTKILNEGWASYWHEKLFLTDNRINGHEIDFAIVNARVTSMPRVGLNPYALGMLLFSFLENSANKGRISIDYHRLRDRSKRIDFDNGAGKGNDFIFNIRKTYCDSMLISEYINQDFVDEYKLFVAGRRLNEQRMTWQYYVKSRKAEDYREMVLDSLYHPPSIEFEVVGNNYLHLKHLFEGKPLVRDYIAGTMLGIEYLWGSPVILDTFEPVQEKVSADPGAPDKTEKPKQQVTWKKYRYTMRDRQLSREEQT
jgi:stage V sporulation protein R